VPWQGGGEAATNVTMEALLAPDAEGAGSQATALED
jgi:hypothetical protein